ncbi:MAG: GGDEF domain-containing protein [Beijerinckiaceae bacterium]|nr:GGDEF domain-containing protein [Beijerinckiaceae bacterium]
MHVDSPNLFLAMFITTAMGAALLFWSWWRNRSDKTLLFAGGALALVGVSVLMLSARGRWPSFLTVDIAHAAALIALAFVWASARVFNGKSPSLLVLSAGPVLWLLACQVMPLRDSFPMATVVSSLLVVVYSLLAAREFWARDGLASRGALSATLLVHAVVSSLRIPVAVSQIVSDATVEAYASTTFVFFMIEAIAFVQALVFLLVSLTKERLEVQLRWTATIDPLSGLPNRRALLDRGAEALAQGLRGQQPTAVIVFDLDRFKDINDSYGHAMGDRVIHLFAEVARANLRLGDHVGRIGGEEFAAVLPRADEEAAGIAIQRVIDIFAQRSTEIFPLRCTVSAGIAASQASTESLEYLLAAADTALYFAKRRGGNRWEAASTAPGHTLSVDVPLIWEQQ